MSSDLNLKVDLCDLLDESKYLSIHHDSPQWAMKFEDDKDEKASVFYIHNFFTKRTGIRILKNSGKSYRGNCVAIALFKLLDAKYKHEDYEVNLVQKNDVNIIVVDPTHLTSLKRTPSETREFLYTSAKLWRIQRILKTDSANNIFFRVLPTDIIDMIIYCLFMHELDNHYIPGEYMNKLSIC
jgi:hypothetical protein